MKQLFRISENATLVETENHQEVNWIHLVNPELAEIETIANHYQFPTDYLTTSLDLDEVSRSESINQKAIDKPALVLLIVSEKTVDTNLDILYTNSPISVILLKDKIITSSKTNPNFINSISANQFRFIKQVNGIHDLLFEISWQIVSQSVFASRDISQRMDQLYQRSRKSSESDLIYNLADLDRSAVYLEHACEANDLVLNDLFDTEFIQTIKRYKDWMNDIVIENHQAKLMIKQTRQILQQLDTTFSSIIQNNLNQTMKILTSLTIIITIPSIIGSLWGMNVKLPGTDHPLAFSIIIGLTLLIMVFVVIWLKRKDLL